MSWDDLRPADNDYLQAHKLSQEEMDIAFVRCFSTEYGQEVIKYLKSMTLDQPTWFPGEDPSYGFARDGQNTIVREILRRIERGKSQ